MESLNLNQQIHDFMSILLSTLMREIDLIFQLTKCCMSFIAHKLCRIRTPLAYLELNIGNVMSAFKTVSHFIVLANVSLKSVWGWGGMSYFLRYCQLLRKYHLKIILMKIVLFYLGVQLTFKF